MTDQNQNTQLPVAASSASATANVPDVPVNRFNAPASFSLGLQGPKTNTNGLGLAKNADELVQRRSEQLLGSQNTILENSKRGRTDYAETLRKKKR